MRSERIAKPLRGDPEAFRSPDPVHHADPEPTQATIILLLLIGEFSILWLLVWKFQVPMVLLISLIRTVRVKPCLLR